MLGERIGGRITDGPITGAAVQVAAELFVELRGGLQVLAVVAFEERHDEAGGAVAALRSEVFHHRLLDRMKFRARDALDRDDVATGHQRQRNKTTVDGAVAAFAARIAVDDRDRARAAIAFGAPFLRTGQAAGAQPFEQGDIRRNRIDADGVTVQSKLDRAAHERRRFWRIFRKERERNSSSERPVASASSSVMAPQAMPRRKKLSRPCPVAASSKTSPKSEASAAFSTKVYKRPEALVRPWRKKV